jgi:hypothetical protein
MCCVVEEEDNERHHPKKPVDRNMNKENLVATSRRDLSADAISKVRQFHATTAIGSLKSHLIVKVEHDYNHNGLNDTI